MIHCITPSFNKTKYIGDAIKSVLNQTDPEFRYWIIENSTDLETKKYVHDLVEKDRDPRIILVDEYIHDDIKKEFYPTAWLLNKYFPYMNGTIMYLSDDDMFVPTAFEKVDQYFGTHPEARVVWFGIQTELYQNDEFNAIGGLAADRMLPAGTNCDCYLDGGQVAFRREVLDHIDHHWYPDYNDGNQGHCDGLFLNKLIKDNNFYNIPEVLMRKRRTELSVFTTA